MSLQKIQLIDIRHFFVNSELNFSTENLHVSRPAVCSSTFLNFFSISFHFVFSTSTNVQQNKDKSFKNKLNINNNQALYLASFV